MQVRNKYINERKDSGNKLKGANCTHGPTLRHERTDLFFVTHIFGRLDIFEQIKLRKTDKKKNKNSLVRL